jgi:hypothetical protein
MSNSSSGPGKLPLAMLLLGIITGLILAYLIISVVSWKIYILIYRNYTLGLLFPYPKYKSIVLSITVIFLLVAFIAVRIIIKLRKR